MKSSNKIPVVIMVNTRMTQDEISIINNRGYRLVFLKNAIKEEEIMMYDFPFEIDLTHGDKTFKLMKQLTEKFNVMRVITFDEHYVELVSQMAEKFNIPYWGLSVEGALNCRHIKNTKKVFQENNIPNAKHVIIQSPVEALSVLSNLDFPVVVKPSNNYGSYNSYICRNIQELIDNVNKIYNAKNIFIGQIIDKDVLVEEYLVGPEFSIETITINGDSNIVAITDNETLNATEITHAEPVLLTEDDIENINSLIKKALKVLKINYSITHTEIKITADGPKIIEVNGSIGGDYIDKIAKHVTGADLRKTRIDIALDGDEAII